MRVKWDEKFTRHSFSEAGNPTGPSKLDHARGLFCYKNLLNVTPQNYLGVCIFAFARHY
jgi:hypothetical protein